MKAAGKKVAKKAARKAATKPAKKAAPAKAKKAIAKSAAKTATKTAPKKPAAKTTSIRGKVFDDATGEPIQALITQGGKFDPTDPEKVTWGFSESRSSSRDGSFSTTIRWADGWTARIVADGEH